MGGHGEGGTATAALGRTAVAAHAMTGGRIAMARRQRAERREGVCAVNGYRRRTWLPRDAGPTEGIATRAQTNASRGRDEGSGARGASGSAERRALCRMGSEETGCDESNPHRSRSLQRFGEDRDSRDGRWCCTLCVGIGRHDGPVVR
jgi:hypothetical protein